MWFSIFLQRMRFDRTTANQKSRYQQSGHDVDAGIYKKGIEAMGMTNGERIRNMSDEELAKFISVQFCHGYGEPQILEWIKQPVED